MAGLVALACAAFVVLPASAGAIQFAPAVNTSQGADSEPSDVAVGSFGASGQLDMAVSLAGDFEHRALAWNGNGNGTFSVAASLNAGTTNSSTQAVAIGDLNGDNDQDVIAGNFFTPNCPPSCNNLVTYLGNGNGTFTPGVNVAAGQSVVDIAVGNFDANATLDIAVANQAADTVSVLLGNGSGGFGAATQYVVGDAPRGVAVGDFNENGALDLAVANQTTDNVSILMGTGTGTFGAAANFPGGDANAGIVVGSFNGDVYADLATANGAGDNVSVLAGDGTGAFGTPTNYPAGDGAVSIEKGSFNSDAYQDLAVANQNANTVSVLLGNAGGGFDAPQNFSVGGGPRSVKVGDFNQDGRSDVITANSTGNNVSVLLQLVTPTLTTQATANATVGSEIFDSADLSGGSNPTGTITFRAYGPNDPTCSNAPAFTSSAVNVSGNGNYDSPGFTPTTAGTYRWRASYSGDANNGAVTGACNEANETSVVAKATPTFSAQASSPAVIGQTITDTATISGYNPTGTITFTVWGPGVPSCNTSAVYQAVVNVNGNGTYSPAGLDTGTIGAIGDYDWIASYSGDANNAAASTACNAAGQSSTVTKATPGLSTQATASVTIGSSISDTATLTGGYQMGGQIGFFAYSDAACQDLVFAETETVSGPGDYSPSPAFTPAQPGTYRWIALYYGDANNNQVQGNCNDPNETSVVTKFTPTISTQATANAPFGGAISDTATLAGGDAPTGTITFRAYGPNDATCAGPAAFTETETVTGSGDYTTDPAFTPAQAGTYRWVASYSGDARNEAVAGACNDPGESSVVAAPVTPQPTPGGGPDPSFTIGALKKRTLTVSVASAGSVRVAPNKLLKAASAGGGPGEVKLRLRLKKKGSSKLAAKGKLTVRVAVTFTPAGGSAATQTAKRKIRGKSKKRK